jgi:carboxypeptidase Taq
MSYDPCSSDRPVEQQLFHESCDHARQVSQLASVESLLGWDEQTMLPAHGGEFRAEQSAAVAAIVHRVRTDPNQGERLQRLADGELARHGTIFERSTIRLLAEDFQRQARVPVALVESLAKVGVEAQQAWIRARKEGNWPLLEPFLTRMFALKKERAACRRPDLDPYDSMLDEYEPEARWRSVAKLFGPLRQAIVPLVEACSDAGLRRNDAVLRRHYPLEKQRSFVHMIAERIGFDFSRGRLDTTAHPFCTTLGPHDCRITTRWDEMFLPTSLYGVLHEAGHGLYEQGLPTDWFGLPPGEACSLGIHESQSRLWENLVGRSAAFWEWCLPLAREAFPTALGDSTASTLHRAVRRVSRSFIRVEADEVTYNLHIMLRFDLERAVVLGDLAVTDLPQAWDDRFEQDFGLRPTDARMGVLQDIHWPAGLIGYFPTYTLGNLHAAQLMAAAQRSISGLDALLAGGNFRPLLAWLRENVHCHGRSLSADELIHSATGEPSSEVWLIESLRHRYGGDS